MISIVIPHKNTTKLLADTLRSIENQYFDDFEVIIQDGGSLPVSILELKTFSAQFENVKLYLEPDESIYDGIANGFGKCQGDILTYINAGDEFMPGSFRYVQRCCDKNKKILLISRRCISFNNVLTQKSYTRYYKLFVKWGFYGSLFPFIQQEGTFFSRSLWTDMSEIDKNRFKKFMLAGDFFLWKNFSHQKVNIISSKLPLAFFLVHSGQLSENIDLYRCEILALFRKFSLLYILHKVAFTLRSMIGR